MINAVILDIDGTLVDTNYQHAIAWDRALVRHDARVPLWRIHRHIGVGGDQIVAELAGDDVEERAGDDIREAESEVYSKLLGEVRVLDGARERTKPQPDLVEAALEKAGEGAAIMIGDTVWDVKAATRAGIDTLAVLSGGFGEDELRRAGAVEVYDSVVDLTSDLDSVLAR